MNEAIYPRLAYIKQITKTEEDDELAYIMGVKLNKVENSIKHNGAICQAIAGHAFLALEAATNLGDHSIYTIGTKPWYNSDPTRMIHEQAEDPSAIINVVLRQMYRDWSPEAAEERDEAYGPIIQFLKKHFEGSQPCVLVPGAGLSYLAFALYNVLNACAVDALEVSTHHILALKWLTASSMGIGEIDSAKFKIRPWALQFSNHTERAHQFRSISIETDGAKSPKLDLGYSDNQLYLMSSRSPETESQAPGDSNPPVYNADYDFHRHGGLRITNKDFHDYQYPAWKGFYSCVATVFFVDTAPNINEYVKIILHVLKDGGIWVNNGPLLWNCYENGPPGRGEGDQDDNFAAQARNGMSPTKENKGWGGKVELAWDELLGFIEYKGFEILESNTDITSGYVKDADSMMMCTYRLGFFAARKRETSELC
jgi:carnosine N-methyltransferase